MFCVIPKVIKESRRDHPPDRGGLAMGPKAENDGVTGLSTSEGEEMASCPNTDGLHRYEASGFCAHCGYQEPDPRDARIAELEAKIQKLLGVINRSIERGAGLSKELDRERSALHELVRRWNGMAPGYLAAQAEISRLRSIIGGSADKPGDYAKQAAVGEGSFVTRLHTMGRE